MKDNAFTRNRIVSHVREKMRSQGIHGWTMDDVSREMQMSKRTIYQVFAAKRQLVGACLDTMVTEGHTYLAERLGASASAVQSLFVVADSYACVLEAWGVPLLSDLAGEPACKEFLQQERLFWQRQLRDAFGECCRQDLLLVGGDSDRFAVHIQGFFWSQMQQGVPGDQLRLVGYLLLRGLFRFGEMADIDKHIPLVTC